MTKRNAERKWRAVDLFSGCGGLSDGLKQSGFHLVSAVENDWLAAETYRVNHPKVKLLDDDISEVSGADLCTRRAKKIHLVAGCPPCQGFSRVRRKNRRRPASDNRNWLIGEFQRIVKELLPPAVFLENVPGIENYYRFKDFLMALRKLGYKVTCESVQLGYFGVPQRRQRVVVLAGLDFEIDLPSPAKVERTVKWAIGDLNPPSEHHNRLHQETTNHSPTMLKRIKAVPKDGGSRSDWPKGLTLDCHNDFDGFKDVYGRMAWDEQAPTITGGCINASKGRFVHPEQDRAITLFEAALLQSFRRGYYFSLERGRYQAAEMIGNALPPEFARRIGRQVISALEENCDG